MERHNECLICTSEKLNKMGRYYQKHNLVKCKSCGFIFIETIPTLKELNDHYSQYSYSSSGYLSPLTVKSYNSLLDDFEIFRKTNKILDVGCGRGSFLQEAKKRGWKVFGTEYSKEAVKICESKGLDMVEGALQPNTFGAEEFDIITSFEVIEHVNNPIEEIGYINKFLRQGGLFYCTTPNFNSYLRFYLKENYNIISYPDHLSFYTKRTLNKLLTDSGFTKSKILTTGISITRLKTSKKISSEKTISKESSDEKLRQKISKKWYLIILKDFANYALSTFGIGMTLKGYFIKS